MVSQRTLKRSLSESDLSCPSVSCQDARGLGAIGCWISKLDMVITEISRKFSCPCGRLYWGKNITSDAVDAGKLVMKTAVCLEAKDMEAPFTCRNSLLANGKFSNAQNACPLYQAKESDILPVTPKPVRKRLETSSPSDEMKEDLVWVNHSPEMFNPFFSGPEEMMLTPKKKKVLGETLLSVQRALNFDSCATLGSLDDNVLEGAMEMACRPSDVSDPNEVVGCSIEGSLVTADLSDDCKTPTLLPVLTGFAETCPGAPLRAHKRAKRVLGSICRKLEF